MSPRLRRGQTSAVGAKPRVLLVDDHPQVLQRLSTMLAEDFDVAAAVTDGSDALDAVRHLAPDLIVLDINMPRVSGLQTMQALSDAGSNIPVVFLSMFDDDEVIAEAFRRGARGYVPKSHVSRHLGSALDQAYDGRLFAPSLTSLFRLDAGPVRHAMQLYGDRSFLDGFAALFDTALRQGDATCVIAPPEIRQGLSMRLRDRGWDLEGLGRYRSIDAAQALSTCMREDLPDADILAGIAAELEQYRRAVTEGPSRRLVVLGHMAERLVTQGNADAAVALETIWNSVTQGLPFFTVCGYHTSCFHPDATNLWSSVCTRHGALTQTSDTW